MTQVSRMLIAGHVPAGDSHRAGRRLVRRAAGSAARATPNARRPASRPVEAGAEDTTEGPRRLTPGSRPPK